MLIAKILLLAFDKKEEEIIDAVMSVIDDFGIDTQLKAVNSNPKLLFHGLYIDEHKRIVVRDEKEIELTYTEFEILLLLAQNAGIVFSKEQIYEAVFGYDGTADDTAVTQHIKNIRAKLRTAGVAAPKTVLKTIWGVGYQWKSET